MDMRSVTTHEAKTQLSALLKEVERGQEIEICRGATPVARLGPIRKAKSRVLTRPRTGTVTSVGVTYQADAFEPLDQAALERWGLV
jgi:prevent-host-death family protein